MGTPFALEPVGAALMGVIEGVRDDQLALATPCQGRTVGQLLQHLVGLTAAFRAAAAKEFGPLTDTDPDGVGWPAPDPDWRTALEEQIPALSLAWADPAAWAGLTRAGGVDLPGEVAAMVALDELVLHGWDLARATGQEFHPDRISVEVCRDFVTGFDVGGTPGLFGPAVPVADDSPLLSRVVARSGRDPDWSQHGE